MLALFGGVIMIVGFALWAGFGAGWLGRLPGKTATHGREINLGANLFLTQLAELLEPTEERATRSPGERFAQNRFFHARRLTDEHHFAQDKSARNGRR